MYNSNLKVPSELYKKIDAMGEVVPKYKFRNREYQIDINVFDAKRKVWNGYIRSSGRRELFSIGSIVRNTSDKWPERSYIILDISFSIWGMKPEPGRSDQAEFLYVVSGLNNLVSLDTFVKNGMIKSVTTDIYYIDSNIAEHHRKFDSIVCGSVEDYVETSEKRLEELKRMLKGKRFCGWNATDEMIYDESDSMFTFIIGDVVHYPSTSGFELIPKNGIDVVMRQRKNETGTLCPKYYDNFVKSRADMLRFPVTAHIKENEEVVFERGFVYSDKNSIAYISHVFKSIYRFAERNLKLDFKQMTAEKFIMPAIPFNGETSSIVSKYRKFLEISFIYGDDRMMCGKTIDKIVDVGRKVWILFSDRKFTIRQTKVIKGEKFYKAASSMRVMKEFGTIHGFFSALTDRESPDGLNDAGRMFVKNGTFTREEIISLSKSKI